MISALSSQGAAILRLGIFAAAAAAVLSSCQPQPPSACDSNYVYQFGAYRYSSGGRYLDLVLYTAKSCPSCELSVSEEGIVEIQVGNVIPCFQYSDDCHPEIREKPQVSLKLLRYCGETEAHPPGRQETIELELEFNGEVYVPKTGWNAAHQVFCKASSDEWISCIPRDPMFGLDGGIDGDGG